jgi:hypothetical protein
MLHGCVAYKYSSTWFILNSSSVEIAVRTVDGEQNAEERNFTLAPGKMRAVFAEQTVCAENFTPINDYSPGKIIPPSGLLPKLELWVGEKQLSPEIFVSENWDYFSSVYIEKYTLSLTDELIKEYLVE